MPIAKPLAISTLALGLVGIAVAQTAGREADDGPRAAPEQDRAQVGSDGRPAGQQSGPTNQLSPAAQDRMRGRAAEALHKHRPSAEKEALIRAALATGASALAASREAMAQRLSKALGLPASDIATLAAPSTSHAPPAGLWVPVLFVSGALPVTTLRSYAAQLERVHGVLAFRGMPGGLQKVAPMAKLSAAILRRDPDCEGPACPMRDVQLIVDPILFRQHGVDRVPALTMVPGDPSLPYCEREDDSPRGAHLVYGDAALSGMLDEYARLGGVEEVRDAQARLARR